jgi:single-strand DNA-binding protein
MFNKVIQIGRLTKDVELRSTQSGVPVATMTIAVNRNYKNSQGQYDTDFFNCVAYRKTAEIMNQYCKKGSLLNIEGRLQSRTYTDNQNQKRYITEIIIDSFQMLEKKEQKPNSNNIENEADDYFNNASGIDVSEDDLPF